MKKIKNLLVLLLVLIATVSLTACGKNDKKEEKKEEKTEQSTEKKVLNVTNTDLFIDPETIKEFEKEYNCKVNYTFFEENEEYYTKLKSGAEKYDVIVASDYMVDTMIKENMLEKLDKSKIPNMDKVKKEYRNLVFDPTSEYSVPYTIGNIGIAYDKSKQEKVDSWADLWSEKNKGEVVMLDGSRFTMAIAMIKEGLDPNSTKVEDIEKAKNSLIAQKKIIKNYVGDDKAKDNLINGDSKLTCIWGGEALLAKDENENVEFVFPKEGAIFIFDNWVIPKVSENKDLAAKFIDFMSRPEISARNCNFVKYGSPIDGARELMDESLKNSDIVFPKKEVFEKGFILKDLGESNEKLQDAWTEIKAK